MLERNSAEKIHGFFFLKVLDTLNIYELLEVLTDYYIF